MPILRHPCLRNTPTIDVTKENQPEIASLFDSAFAGESGAVDIHSDTYGANYIFTSVPIISTKSNKIMGAVFVNQISESQT